MPPKKKLKLDKDEKKRKLKEEKSSKSAAIYSRWLMKSEPESRIEKGVDVKFGIEDLKKEPNQTACWDGVRNYQARNFMRDQMKLGQLGFFYHSNCKCPGIAGVIEIVKEGYDDHTQFDKKDPHYDPTSKKESPKWQMVDVKFVRMMKRYIPLSELKELYQKHKANGGPLANVALFTRARLSVQPLTEVTHQKMHECACNLNKGSYSQECDTWSEMGKLAQAEEEFDFILSLEDLQMPE